MSAFYNEIEPYPAAWLRNLIAAGHIAPGVVDEGSITDLDPQDLEGFAQCHFFAGVGVWSHAFRLAGVPDHAAIWSGSCPCQPLSVAGKRGGAADRRHLWPAWFRLIRERRPAAVFGEQVASRAGLEWFDAVRADLESEGYSVAAADLCAAGAGAPHIRQRLYFVGLGNAEELGRGARDFRDAPTPADREGARLGGADARGEPGVMGDAGFTGLEGLSGHGRDGNQPGRLNALEGGPATAAGPPDGLADTGGERAGRHPGAAPGPQAGGEGARGADGFGRGDIVGAGGATFWTAADWIACRDGKARPVEPGTFPLAHGVAARVGRLRAYGNAIVPQAAAEFVRAAMETILPRGPQ